MNKTQNIFHQKINDDFNYLKQNFPQLSHVKCEAIFNILAVKHGFRPAALINSRKKMELLELWLEKNETNLFKWRKTPTCYLLFNLKLVYNIKNCKKAIFNVILKWKGGRVNGMGELLGYFHPWTSNDTADCTEMQRKFPYVLSWFLNLKDKKTVIYSEVCRFVPKEDKVKEKHQQLNKLGNIIGGSVSYLIKKRKHFKN